MLNCSLRYVKLWICSCFYCVLVNTAFPHKIIVNDLKSMLWKFGCFIESAEDTNEVIRVLCGRHYWSNKVFCVEQRPIKVIRLVKMIFNVSTKIQGKLCWVWNMEKKFKLEEFLLNFIFGFNKVSSCMIFSVVLCKGSTNIWAYFSHIILYWSENQIPIILYSTC